jgi:hypothetical protein
VRALSTVSAFALALFVSAVDTPVAKPADKQPDYFPSRVGDKWVYVYVDGPEKTKGVESTWTVLAVEEKSGVKTVHLGQLYSIDGKFHEDHDLELSAKGILQTRSPRVIGIPRKKYDSPRVDLKLPHKEGQTWDNDDLKETLTAHGPEEVKVLAGTYQAIRVEHRKKGDTKSEVFRTEWFAPRVGVVKIKINTGSIAIEMKSFTPGKD